MEMALPEEHLGLAIVAIVLLSLFVVSLGLWIWLLRQLGTGHRLLSRRFRSDVSPVPQFAVVLTIAYLLIGFTALLTRHAPAEFDAEQMIKNVDGTIVEGIVAVIVLMLIVVSMTPYPTGLVRLGFRGDRPGRQFGTGILTFLASLFPVMIMMLVTQPLRSVETTHPFLRLVDEVGPGREFLSIAFAAVIVAPLKEELMFRVILQSWLVRWVGVAPAIIGAAIIFAAVHGFPDSIALLPLALILGVVYHWRRSYLAVVIAHAVFNAFNLTLMLVSSHAMKSLEVSS